MHNRIKNRKDVWHYSYWIRPPKGRPFFPSDEALRTIIARFPRIRFLSCTRFIDHDVLSVRGLDDNLFRTIADLAQRKMRRAFLRCIGECALTARLGVRPNIAAAAEQFLAKCGYVNTTWTGMDTISYTKDGYCYEGRKINQGPHLIPTKRFKRICRGELPFFYGTALP